MKNLIGFSTLHWETNLKINFGYKLLTEGACRTHEATWGRCPPTTSSWTLDVPWVPNFCTSPECRHPFCPLLRKALQTNVPTRRAQIRSTLEKKSNKHYEARTNISVRRSACRNLPWSILLTGSTWLLFISPGILGLDGLYDLLVVCTVRKAKQEKWISKLSKPESLWSCLQCLS